VARTAGAVLIDQATPAKAHCGENPTRGDQETVGECGPEGPSQLCHLADFGGTSIASDASSGANAALVMIAVDGRLSIASKR
jgi:hypothetical protein